MKIIILVVHVFLLGQLSKSREKDTLGLIIILFFFTKVSFFFITKVLSFLFSMMKFFCRCSIIRVPLKFKPDLYCSPGVLILHQYNDFS